MDYSKQQEQYQQQQNYQQQQQQQPQYQQQNQIHPINDGKNPPMYAQPPPGQPQMYGQPPMGQPQMYGQPPMGAYAQVPNYGYQQPQMAWMQRPDISGCPPGLEYLTQIDQLLIKQHIELGEVLTGFQMNNRYAIRNVMGQMIYFAKEDTDCCTRQFCGPQRPFVLHITDNTNQEVIQIRRPCKFMCVGQCFSCSECCQDMVEVEAPPGNLIGYVKQLYEGCDVRYSILNENQEVILRLHGPSYCHCYCPGDDYPLELMSADGQVPVGRVSKQWSNLMQEYFTSADNFGIQFPMDLDVKAKAVVLGAVFLIDFMYFEQQKRNHHH